MSLIFTQATLGKNEEILFVAKPHWARFLKPVCAMLLSFAFLAAGFYIQDLYTVSVGVIFFIPSFFCWVGQMQVEIVCTNRRVIYKRGAYWYRTQELRLPKIESVAVWQPIAAGLVGCGTLYFTGTGGTQLAFKYVSDPFAAKAAFEDAIEQAAE